MDEKEFIYGRIKYLTESVDFILNAMEQQQGVIDDLVKIIAIMQSPEYTKKQSDALKAIEIAGKIELMRSMMDKR